MSEETPSEHIILGDVQVTIQGVNENGDPVSLLLDGDGLLSLASKLMILTGQGEQQALGEDDGTLRKQLVLYDHGKEVQVRASADSDGSNVGALHIKLKGRAEVVKEELLEQQLGWLKTIAFQLGEITGDQLVPDDLEE